jgi:large subunit ribosomal protein L22|tara:strand:+ start:335 stop:685 length:351 start_codon:yes stop_codon:yes gene_type:complete
MSVTARNKNIGVSAKKLRYLLGMVRGKKASDAVNILSFMTSNSSDVVLKLLKSAIANAESSQYGTRENLVISTIFADQAATMKRWRARARGRAGTFNRPQSHLFIELKDNTIQEEI